MSVETERINISSFVTSLSEPIATDAADFDPATDCMVRVEHLERALGDIALSVARVESLESALGDIALSAAQTNTLLVRGMLCIADIQKFIPHVATTANNARPIGPKQRGDQGGGNLP